jgi:sulfur-carrier protein adenylyltransferase/sulfurtransferase
VPKSLSQAERQRYARHLTLKDIGEKGQLKLKNARVLVMGLGGLGSPVALYLAAAGVGRLGLVDCDRVETSNLQRQVLHGSTDVGRLKTESAARRLEALNPDVTLDLYNQRLEFSNALDIMGTYDLVVDGGDNFKTRYVVNDACLALGIPWISGSILGFEGQLSVFNYQGGPCYRCLFPRPLPPELAPACVEAGVLGVLPGVIGSLQATETLKVLLGLGDISAGRLLTYDALALRFSHVGLHKDPACRCHGVYSAEMFSSDYTEATQDDRPPSDMEEISPAILKRDFRHYVLLDVREDWERRDLAIYPSIHWPFNELYAHRGGAEALASKDKALIAYCASGQRSKSAARELRLRGYTNVRTLRGGLLAWCADGALEDVQNERDLV